MSYKDINDEQRAQCWHWWNEKQSIHYVAKKSGFSRATIDRMREKEKWDKRLTRIKEEATIIADARSSKRLARNLEILKSTKEKIVAGIKKNKIKGNVSDIPALIKTEELLIGKPDSRPDQANIITDPVALRAKIERLAEDLGWKIQFGITSQNGSMVNDV